MLYLSDIGLHVKQQPPQQQLQTVVQHKHTDMGALIIAWLHSKWVEVEPCYYYYSIIIAVCIKIGCTVHTQHA